MSLTSFFQGIFTLLSGPLGVAIIGALLVIGIIEAVFHRSLRPFVIALMGGAGFYSVSWFMSTVMQGGGP